MARVTILRARFWPSLRASDSMSRTISAASRLAWFSMPADQLGLGLVGGEAGDPLQHGAALLGQAAELGPLLVDLPLRLGQRVAALLGLARVLVDPLLALGQPGFPALQVAAQLPDLFLDLPDLVLDLAARGGGLLGCGLRPAHDRGRVGLGPVPDLAGLSGGVGQDAVTLFRAALFPFLLLRGVGEGGGRRRRGGREVTGAGAPPEDDENQGDKRGDEPDRQDQLDSVTQRSPLPLMGADLPPGRYIGHALQRGAACRCDQAPGQPGTGPPRWQPSGGAANVHAPGKVPSWLASSSPAPRRSGPPAGGRWAPAGPPGLDLAGRCARPVLNPFTGPGWLPFGPADLAFRCSLLIVLAYRDPACAEQNTSLP